MNTDKHGLSQAARRSPQDAGGTVVVPQASSLPRHARFSRRLTLHYKVICTAWIVLAGLLFVFPGFECRGFAMGFIVGYWPAFIPWQPIELLYGHDVVALLSTFALSGTEVGVCAWIINRAGGIAFGRTILFMAILVSAVWFSRAGISYGQWRYTSPVQQAMNSPEINYQPTYRDFCTRIAIPRALAGGMVGLYFATGLCTLAALAKPVIRNSTHGGTGSTPSAARVEPSPPNPNATKE